MFLRKYLICTNMYIVYNTVDDLIYDMSYAFYVFFRT